MDPKTKSMVIHALCYQTIKISKSSESSANTFLTCLRCYSIWLRANKTCLKWHRPLELNFLANLRMRLEPSPYQRAKHGHLFMSNHHSENHLPTSKMLIVKFFEQNQMNLWYTTVRTIRNPKHPELATFVHWTPLWRPAAARQTLCLSAIISDTLIPAGKQT